MRNEPGSFSRDGQPIHVDVPDPAVIPSDVEMPGAEVVIGADDGKIFEENPSVEPRYSRPNSLSHSDHLNEDESHLNSLSETCAQRLSMSSVPPVPSNDAPSAVACNLLTCQTSNGKKRW